MTLPYASTLAVGRFTASQYDCVVRPGVIQDLPLVIYLHGAGGDGREATGYNFPSIPAKLAALAQAGFTVLAPTMTETWGNSTTDSRIADAIAWARTNLGIGYDPPIFYGASHGSTCAFDYATDHVTAGIVSVLSIPDLQNVVANNVSGLRSSVNTAYGRAAGDTTTLPAGADPATQTTALSQVAQLLYYSTDDAFSTNIATYATATGASLRSVGAQGHTDAAAASAPTEDILRFCRHHSRKRVTL